MEAYEIAQDLMTDRVILAHPEMPLREAYELMTNHKIRHLPVISEEKLVGVVSDRDVFRYAEKDLFNEMDIPNKPISLFMTLRPRTCLLTDSVSHVANLMLSYKVDCIPVKNEKDLIVGIITTSDILELVSTSRCAEFSLPITRQENLRW